MSTNVFMLATPDAPSVALLERAAPPKLSVCDDVGSPRALASVICTEATVADADVAMVSEVP